MNFLLNSETAAIGELVQKFFHAELPAEKVRLSLSDPAKRFDESDRRLWEKFLSLGVVSACLPENLGGLGLGLLSGSVVLENCFPLNHLPVFQTLTYAILPLRACPEGAELLKVMEEINSGKAIVSGVTLMAGEGLQAERFENNFRLSGEVFPLAGGKETDLLIVSLIDGEEVFILASDLRIAPRGSYSLEPLQTLDPLRHYSSLRLEETPFQILGTLPMEIFSEVESSQLVLSAAELSGLAELALRQTVEYTKSRTQFGRAIGSFQAVQHKLADMLVAKEQTASLVRFAGWCADNADPQFKQAAAAAKAFASEAVPNVIESAIQLHGGIGFTYESDLHLWLRRAKVQSILFGDEAESARNLAEIELSA